MDKKQLRKQLRVMERDFLSSGNPAGESARIWARLEELPAFRSASTVLVYMSLPGEPDTSALLRRWYARKRFAIPRVVADSLELREYSPDSVRPGYMGTYEPSPQAPAVSPSELDLAVVPGVAFAPLPSGSYIRMGHGGGFYDRLLPLLTCPVVGVCYSFRLLSSLPCDPWDIPVGAVISGIVG